MIYLVTYMEYNESRHKGDTKRLIFVESKMVLELGRVTDLIKMLTNGNFNALSVEIAGQKDWDVTRINHPALRIYQLD